MNRKKFLKLFSELTLILFFSIHLLYTQTLPLKHYSAEDGLASSMVNCIYQDSEGYLWFGTEYGLSRFNGAQFKNFLSEADGPKSDFITDLFEDRKGNLWIGTRGGGLIRKNRAGAKTYTTRDGLPNNRIFAIVEDREGNLWLGTRSGISRFNGTDFTTFSKKHGLADDFVTAIIIDKIGNLWIGTQKGLSYLEKKNGKKRFVNYTTENGLIDNEIYALTIDREGNTWVGTRGGLSCFQKKSAAFISYSIKDGMSDNFVNAVIEDKSGNIWAATIRGVSCLPPSRERFIDYYVKNGFPSDSIYAVFEDREGNIWFGTSMGASRLQSLKITNFSQKDGLPDNSVWAIIEEEEGKYWMGTDKGLSRYSAGTFKTYTTRDGLISNSIFNLLKDRNGNIWIATLGGLSIYSSKTGKFVNYSANDGLPGEIVISFAEDSSGTVWIGTDKGLCRFINNKIVPPDFEYKPDSLPIHAMLNDGEGNFWFSDTKVLWKVSGNRLRHYSARDGLIHNEVTSLLEDSRGRIWIGTRGGVSCFTNGKFINYTTGSGLSHNVCLFLLEDDYRNMWIGTANGINRYDGKTFKTYTSRDGLISNEMRDGACLKDSRGVLWFGTIKGTSRFDPRLDRVNTLRPPVYITNFSVWGKEHPRSDNLTLKHDENYLKFGFIGLSFTSPEGVVYKYLLKGLDRDWNTSGNREASYTSLTPGQYVFKVIAINNDGIESSKPAEFPFRILPPFWKTWWFQFLAVLSALTTALMIVLLQIKRVREKVAKRERDKQLIMAQRMKLLGILAGGAVHDLKNLLGIIIGYSDIAVEYVEEEDEEKSEALEIIKNTADTAFHVVKQMLAFTRQSYDEKSAANLSHLLDDLLEILKVTVPKKITVSWKPVEEEILMYINPVKFKQLVMNLCLNAVQAMQEEGELKISLGRDPEKANQIILEVSDTGPGIEEEIIGKIFDPLFTTKDEEKGAGLGLFVVKQIVDEYGGKIDIHSTPGEGTTFSVRFPVEKSPQQGTSSTNT